MGKNEITKEVVFYGRVQGVNFRNQTCNMARNLGLFGWVTNQPDGTVKMVVTGEREKIDELITFCITGIVRANVERHEERLIQHTAFQDFSIV